MLMVFGNWHLSLPLSFVNPLDLLEHSSSTLSDLHCDEVLGLSENSMLDEYLDHFLFLNCPYNAQVSFNCLRYNESTITTFPVLAWLSASR